MAENKKANHPNRVPFEGILTLLDEPSDRSPTGSRGHRVILTREAAEQDLDTLIGMAVNISPDFDNHAAHGGKCGVIMSAEIVQTTEGPFAIKVRGHLYMRDFPELRKYVGPNSKPLGMSYELADAHVENMRADIWKLTKVTFTGAAVLLATKAAYQKTTFNISAATERFDGTISFIDRKLKTGQAETFTRSRSKTHTHPGTKRGVH